MLLISHHTGKLRRAAQSYFFFSDRQVLSGWFLSFFIKRVVKKVADTLADVAGCPCVVVKWCVLFLFVFLFCGVSEGEFAVDIFLGGDQGGFWQSLVEARDFDLLAVFVDFLEVVGLCGELLQFFLEVGFHFGCDLVGAFADDGHGLVDVAGLLGQVNEVVYGGAQRGVGSFVIHNEMWWCLCGVIIFR